MSVPTPRSPTHSSLSLSSHDSTSNSSDDGYYDSDDELALAQQEWDESMQQLQWVVSLVLMPLLGKWLGRKWSGWAYERYLRLGFGREFFLGNVGLGLSFRR